MQVTEVSAALYMFDIVLWDGREVNGPIYVTAYLTTISSQSCFPRSGELTEKLMVQSKPPFFISRETQLKEQTHYDL